MAPVPSNKKRKRDRLQGASSQETARIVDDEESARPRKRTGLTSRKENNDTSVVSGTTFTEQKSGRQALGDTTDVGQPTRKSGRLGGKLVANRGPREARSLGADNDDAGDREPARKGPRQKQDTRAESGVTSHKHHDKTNGPAGKRGGKSASSRKQHLAKEGAPDDGPTSRSGRGGRSWTQGDRAASKRASNNKSTGKSRPNAPRVPLSDEAAEDERARPMTTRQSQHNNSPDPSSPLRSYRHIAPRTLHVPLAIIEANWTPLAGQSVASILSLLRLAERPVLQDLNAGPRREHAAKAIRTVTKRLMRGFSKSQHPFPPVSTTAANTMSARGGRRARRREDDDSGRATELNFERSVDAAQELEQCLDPLLHSVEVLQAEKERLQNDLDDSYVRLRQLRADSRMSGRTMRERLRRAHDLVPELESNGEGEEKRQLKAEFVTDHEVGSLHKTLQEDEELRQLATQLSGHVDSMRGNVDQVEGISQRIQQSAALLRLALQKHVGEKNATEVLFG